jgi:Spy/CpxP family protein refolding chaperone
MKTLRALFISLSLLAVLSLNSQDNAVNPTRTPEQEAIKQTEKLQQELELTPEQAKQIYEINLRYARERQISNTRSEALERMKNKDSDIQRVLNENQYNQLQNKRYERSSINNQPNIRSIQPSTSPGFRSSSPEPSLRSVRTPNTEPNIRSSYRSGSQNNSENSSPTVLPTPVRRNDTRTPAVNRTPQNNGTNSGGATRSPSTSGTQSPPSTQKSEPNRSSTRR